MVKAAEGTGVRPHLAVRLPETTSIFTIVLKVSVREALVMTEPWTPSEEVVAVDERVAPGDKRVVVEDDGPVVPIEAPCGPSPAAAPAEPDPYADTKGDERRVNPGSHEVTWIHRDGRPIDDPGIVFGNIHDLRVGRFNDDRLALRRHRLLRRAL